MGKYQKETHRRTGMAKSTLEHPKQMSVLWSLIQVDTKFGCSNISKEKVKQVRKLQSDEPTYVYKEIATNSITNLGGTFLPIYVLNYGVNVRCIY